MRISDWSSDVCSSDLNNGWGAYFPSAYISQYFLKGGDGTTSYQCYCKAMGFGLSPWLASAEPAADIIQRWLDFTNSTVVWSDNVLKFIPYAETRSEEHTSELQSLMRISYAVFCLKKKNRKPT